MRKEDTEMIEKIMDSQKVGYAYFYPSNGGNREEFMISTSVENIANYLGSHLYDAKKIIITDMVDRLILDTFGGFVNNCPDQEFCKELIPHLAPIQMGDKEVGEILQVSRDAADAYFATEDEAVTMAECSML